MKNKENVTVKQLTDKLTELCTAKFPNDPSMKWAYTCGVLEAMLDWELKGYSEKWDTLQDRVNQAFERYEQELQGELELAASRD
jgi:hypothetical protein